MNLKPEFAFSLRSLLAVAVLGATLGLAGCHKATDSASIVPVEIDRSTSCDLDGMLLSDYPGPKAQIFYADQEKPAFFCDTMEVLSTLLAGEQVRAVRAVFVQDMAKADWDHPEGHWIDARSAFYVFGSKRTGSMGPTVGSFALEADAQHFAAENGGKVLAFAAIKPDMVDLSGGAQHDSRM